jgi:protein involved in polysaccharide export with SLBB domain
MGTSPKFSRRLTVTVKTENRVFYVYGDVRAPGRLMYAGEITVLRAIASSGGFTDFAARAGRVGACDGREGTDRRQESGGESEAGSPGDSGDTVFVPRRSPFGN